MDAAIGRNNAPAGQRSGSVFVALATSAFFFMIAFPKAGVKTGGLPITFGYLLSVPLLLFSAVRARGVSVPLDRLLAMFACALLAGWSGIVVYANGADGFSGVLSFFISVLYLPLFGLTFCSALVLDDYGKAVERSFLWAVRFIIAYGIFLFLFREVTGKWIEIPYLTVNADDVGGLNDKYINRGGIFKLISTYNNGNIFGICVCILAPLYLKLENKSWLRLALYVAMFLTLSRTVWIGTLLVLGLRAFSRGVRPLTVMYFLLTLLVAGGALIGLLDFLGRDMSFVFDTNLGGRAGQLDVLQDIVFIPGIPVGTLPEIIYLGVLKYFGLIGLFFFVLHLFVVPLLLWLEGTPLLSVSKSAACLQGLLIYAVIAGADAAFALIPVMMIYWMIAGLGFWYAHRQLLLPDLSRAPAR